MPSCVCVCRCVGMHPLPPTDNIHVFDQPGPSNNSPESLSEGIKRLKFAKLKEIIDKLNMEMCMIFWCVLRRPAWGQRGCVRV